MPHFKINRTLALSKTDLFFLIDYLTGKQILFFQLKIWAGDKLFLMPVLI